MVVCCAALGGTRVLALIPLVDTVMSSLLGRCRRKRCCCLLPRALQGPYRHVGMQVQLLGTLDTIDVKYDSRISGLIGVCAMSNVDLVRISPCDTLRALPFL